MVVVLVVVIASSIMVIVEGAVAKDVLLAIAAALIFEETMVATEIAAFSVVAVVAVTITAAVASLIEAEMTINWMYSLFVILANVTHSQDCIDLCKRACGKSKCWLIISFEIQLVLKL